MITCDRCGTKTNIWIMSMFNRDELCGSCKEKEREHPMYQEACDEECRQIKAGNFNYDGIGKPEDL